jgi:hypothetical protein
VLAGGELARVLLVLVAPGEDVLVAEEAVAVEGDLASARSPPDFSTTSGLISTIDVGLDERGRPPGTAGQPP